MRLYAGQIISDETGAKFILVPVENKSFKKMPSDFNGSKVRAARKKRGWTQAKLAEQAKITQATVSSIEQGQTPHHPVTLEAIWNALNSY